MLGFDKFCYHWKQERNLPFHGAFCFIPDMLSCLYIIMQQRGGGVWRGGVKFVKINRINNDKKKLENYLQCIVLHLVSFYKISVWCSMEPFTPLHYTIIFFKKSWKILYVVLCRFNKAFHRSYIWPCVCFRKSSCLVFTIKIRDHFI